VLRLCCVAVHPPGLVPWCQPLAACKGHRNTRLGTASANASSSAAALPASVSRLPCMQRGTDTRAQAWRCGAGSPWCAFFSCDCCMQGSRGRLGRAAANGTMWLALPVAPFRSVARSKGSDTGTPPPCPSSDSLVLTASHTPPPCCPRVCRICPTNPTHQPPTATSGQRCSLPTRLVRLRRLAWTTTRQWCRRDASSGERRCACLLMYGWVLCVLCALNTQQPVLGSLCALCVLNTQQPVKLGRLASRVRPRGLWCLC
jgi:hypothetical protein